MTDDANADDGDEYRPTDWLALCGLSFGIGSHEDAAMMNALRYEGPWDDDRDEPVEVAVWNLYADSWESHSLRGPERGADWLTFTRYEIPVEEAREASAKGSQAYSALSTARHRAEVVEEQESKAEAEQADAD